MLISTDENTMKKFKHSLSYFILLGLFGSLAMHAFADTPINIAPSQTQSAVEQRATDENAINNNPYAISAYQPSYILPFYYTQTPDNQVYAGNTPNNQALSRDEVKYQFSFKVPAWKIGAKDYLYLAYSQMSYWQAYAGSAYFRETNYEPEIFDSHQLNYNLLDGWTTNFLNVGAMHQSNGKGGDLERSWNRLYVQAISSKGNWMVSIRPWFVYHDPTYERDNPDMTRYMGHGDFIAAYKYNTQVFSLTLRNEAESGFSRGTEMLTWSFPLTVHLRAYVQLFSGYGQSLIEYNHYTNGAGIGVSLSDWL
ncbi:MAG: phospholipase [Gammaproteobacteria bacterium]|jgi:phospholipase A1|nr:phospholipase [Gammaproteobacteria bacterium]